MTPYITALPLPRLRYSKFTANPLVEAFDMMFTRPVIADFHQIPNRTRRSNARRGVGSRMAKKFVSRFGR